MRMLRVAPEVDRHLPVVLAKVLKVAKVNARTVID